MNFITEITLESTPSIDRPTLYSVRQMVGIIFRSQSCVQDSYVFTARC